MNLTLDILHAKVAVVTGASAGIGKAIAIALVNRGLWVVGLARRKEKLEELAKQLENENGRFFPLRADVSKEEDILSAFHWIKANVGPVHVLINNAAVMRPNGLIDGTTKSWKEILDTNVLGLCIATREAVSDMKANNINGNIIHINSVAGHYVPCTTPNLYPASKWAVTTLTETLRRELNTIGSRIKVTSISPGITRTEVFVASGIVLSDEQKKALEAAPLLEPEDVADCVIFVLSTPPHVQVHELLVRPLGEPF